MGGVSAISIWEFSTLVLNGRIVRPPFWGGLLWPCTRIRPAFSSCHSPAQPGHLGTAKGSILGWALKLKRQDERI